MEGDTSASSSSAFTGAIAVLNLLKMFEEVRHAECMQVVTCCRIFKAAHHSFARGEIEIHTSSQIKELNESIAAVEAEAVDIGNDVNRPKTFN